MANTNPSKHINVPEPAVSEGFFEDNTTQMQSNNEDNSDIETETVVIYADPIAFQLVEPVELPVNNNISSLPQPNQEKQQQLKKQCNTPFEKQNSFLEPIIRDDEQPEELIVPYEDRLELAQTREQLLHRFEELIQLEIQEKIEIQQLLEQQQQEQKLREQRLQRQKPTQKSNAEQTRRKEQSHEEKQSEDADEKIILGSCNTTISRKDFTELPWDSASLVIRKLLRIIIGQNVLAVSSLSGKPSPAFLEFDKPKKAILNPEIVKDITDFITENYKISVSEIRHVMTIACADAAKMEKTKLNNQQSNSSLVNDKNQKKKRKQSHE